MRAKFRTTEPGLGYFRTRRDGVTGTLVVDHRCDHHRGDVPVSMPSNAGAHSVSSETLRKRMRTDGWLVLGSRDVCPACVERIRAERVGKEEEDLDKGQGNTTAQAAPATGTARPTPSITRKVFALLEEHFREAHGQYEPGWDDERLSRELGVHLDVVSFLRREAFGEIRLDPTLARMRQDLQSLLDKAAELDARMSSYEKGRSK